MKTVTRAHKIYWVMLQNLYLHTDQDLSLLGEYNLKKHIIRDKTERRFHESQIRIVLLIQCLNDTNSSARTTSNLGKREYILKVQYQTWQICCIIIQFSLISDQLYPKNDYNNTKSISVAEIYRVKRLYNNPLTCSRRNVQYTVLRNTRITLYVLLSLWITREFWATTASASRGKSSQTISRHLQLLVLHSLPTLK